MKILLAEDEPLSRHLLNRLLTEWGYEVLVADDGLEAWSILQSKDAPKLAILDWMMPQPDGLEVCRRLRAREDGDYVYVILLTVKTEREDVVEGLEAGADDYITKPFDEGELHSRVRAAQRIVELETALGTKIEELESALKHVQRLQGLLPICMHCKKIRDEKSTWHRLETYIEDNSEAMFSHALCDECLATFYPDKE